ncbi:MAG: amino acid ABC transporter substrate-binding protein [Parvibaculales bacterium]
MKKLVEIFAASAALTLLTLLPVRAAEDTLQVVQQRGYVKCGVSQGLPGFSNPDDKGNWNGIDVDLCRAVAAAVFGTDEKVKFTPLSAKERFTALQSGEVDLLARNTTWSMHRDTALGVDFTGVNYYDGQGFMVRAELGITGTKELDGASLCTNLGTTTELNAADYFRTHNMQYEMVAFEKADEAVSAYNTGRCDAYTTDQSALYAQRLKLTDPKAHVVLPQIISKEPLGPVVRQGDNQWGDIVRWSHNAMLNAEELGVTSSNVETMKSSTNPSIKRLLGLDGSFGANMGISNDWAYHIIRTVGNYAETFERNVGKDTPLGIARGVNALWKDGGLQYAPPIR